jgi:hypothetical protein
MNRIMADRFKPGDLLVYKKQKHSNQPGPRAHSTAASVQDGVFSYVVDKYWIVTAVDDDTLEVLTPGQKRHRLKMSDPNLRRVNWWQRFWYRSRFRQLKQAFDEVGSSSAGDSRTVADSPSEI